MMMMMMLVFSHTVVTRQAVDFCSDRIKKTLQWDIGACDSALLYIKLEIVLQISGY